MNNNKTLKCNATSWLFQMIYFMELQSLAQKNKKTTLKLHSRILTLKPTLNYYAETFWSNKYIITISHNYNIK